MKNPLLLLPLFILLLAVPWGDQMPAQAASHPVTPAWLAEVDETAVTPSRSLADLTAFYLSDHFVENGLRCGTHIPANIADLEATPTDCSLSRTIIQNEYWPGNLVYLEIPTVVHIIHKTDGTGNLTNQRVINQIAVLNEDFGAFALDSTGTDVRIRFNLVTITRTANDAWHEDQNEIEYKQALAWDPNEYMNIYVNSASGYLGYAYLPQSGAAGQIYDGVVIYYEAFGGRNEGGYPYNQGRTAVHEVGHYLGLLHTFEGGGCFTGYTGGDLVADTNSENVEHYSCASQTFTCSTPDPLDNFMNYTDDACMTEFTAEQANRLVCVLMNYRPQLYTLVDLAGLTPSAYLPMVLKAP